MSDFVALNGQITPYEDARIAPFDAGFLHGAGLFETMRAAGGRVFQLTQHLQRLHASAAELSIDVHLDTAATADLIAELLEANGLTEARVRLTVTRGDVSHINESRQPNSTPGVPDASADSPRTVLISAGPFTAYPAALYEKGMTVAIARPFQNPSCPTCGHKTTSYLDRLLVLREAQKSGSGEALWFTAAEKFLAEGCISNVFLVDRAGVLLTPPWVMPGAKGQRLALPGIARQTVLELAKTEGLTVRESRLTMTDVAATREMFLTNVIMGVMPVVRVQRQAIGEEKPGPQTLRLRQLFERKMKDDLGANHG